MYALRVHQKLFLALSWTYTIILLKKDFTPLATIRNRSWFFVIFSKREDSLKFHNSYITVAKAYILLMGVGNNDRVLVLKRGLIAGWSLLNAIERGKEQESGSRSEGYSADCWILTSGG